MKRCLLLALCLMAQSITVSVPQCSARNKDCRAIKQTFCQKGPATVFVHGSLYPLLDILVHAVDSPLGLVPAKYVRNQFLHRRIPYLLSCSDPKQFPFDSFYLYGWSGKISFEGRETAAHQLYNQLKHFTGPITLICHSHGGNVALNLAKVVDEVGDKKFTIDRLILLACPVQAVTEDLVCHRVFKKVISLYSLGDSTQVRDPQKFYTQTRCYARRMGKDVPMFSQRIFPCHRNIIQRRMLLGRRNLTHMDFIYKPFLSRLPQVLSMIDQSVKDGCFNTDREEYVIDIPRYSGNPELLVKSYG